MRGPGKEDTAVLDFANDTDEIQKAFEPYYDRTILSESTDLNLLYDLQTRLVGFHFYTTDDLNAFARVFFCSRCRRCSRLSPLRYCIARKGASPSSPT
jgi:type I restriction enzyme R subunit